MKAKTIENYTCFVGQNAKENWYLLDQAKSEYLFFHLRSFPSCYVILQTEENVDNNIIEQCAKICKENTKYRNRGKIYVDYTTVSNVKKGSDVGEVVYKSKKKVEKIKV